MLTYDPTTGEMARNGVVIGARSKGSSNTYLLIRHQGKVRKAHRVAFELMDVTIPQGKEVDHINRDGTDNRWCNLRLVTRSENQRNKKVYTNSASGMRGYNYRPERKSPHCARVYVKGKSVSKSFTSKAEALEWIQATK